MNFSQKLGIFCLIVITVLYVYFSFFSENNFFTNRRGEQSQYETKTENGNTIGTDEPENNEKHVTKTVKIFVTDAKGNMRSVSRKCDTAVEKSCFAFAIKELIAAPTEWEKNRGLSSEVPSNTKILSVREGANNILIDFSPEFESGGGAESTYIRVEQLIKTSLANTKLPVYLYINGKQADVIGGEGIMIKQPLSEKSLND